MITGHGTAGQEIVRLAVSIVGVDTVLSPERCIDPDYTAKPSPPLWQREVDGPVPLDPHFVIPIAPLRRRGAGQFGGSYRPVAAGIVDANQSVDFAHPGTVAARNVGNVPV